MTESPPFRLSLTFDIEMCSNFPYWTTIWDHRKGAIDADTKQYVLKLLDLARQHNVKFQWFVLGSSFEDPDIDYLRRVAADGHAIGNHTYHHINVKAKTFDELQVRYRQEPRLREDVASAMEAIRREIVRTNDLVRERLKAEVRGFRTPGGFRDGLRDVPEIQSLLREVGFAYASSRYDLGVDPEWKQRYKRTEGRASPAWAELERALESSIDHLQPYEYPNGLPEIPMMGISDVWAFRVLDLEREEWIRLLLQGLEFSHDHGMTYSILMHPHVLASRDPHTETVLRLIEAAKRHGGAVVTNDELADA